MVEIGIKRIILFDGVCNLCTGSVQFILRHDRNRRFLFASLQSQAGREIVERLRLQVPAAESFILLEDKRVYQRSTAALRVARHLGGFWRLAYPLIVVPRFLRDGVYDFVAQNRYAWFGKKNECWLPAPDLVERFLD